MKMCAKCLVKPTVNNHQTYCSIECKIFMHTVDVLDCKIWVAYIDKYGIPTLIFDGKPKKAHRLIYEDYHNKKLGIYQKLYKTCGDKMCVNPKHLTETNPNPLYGLTTKIKATIIQFSKNGILKDTEITEIFDVPKSYMSNIKRDLKK